jgi:ParB-like chromosome segregation protein Spo0J
LARWCPGSEDWDWPSEWAEIAQHNAGVTLANLIGYIAVNGISEPVLLGDDGRVWDGHHRLMVARLLGIRTVPVEYGRGGRDTTA